MLTTSSAGGIAIPYARPPPYVNKIHLSLAQDREELYSPVHFLHYGAGRSDSLGLWNPGRPVQLRSAPY